MRAYSSDRIFLPAVTALFALSATACSDNGPGRDGPGEWTAQIDTIGDTVVVRTMSGSEWGRVSLEAEVRIGALDGADHEILGAVSGLAVGPGGEFIIYDRQVPALRRYASDGAYLGTLGREGGGPGEYANSDGGLTVLTDGRIILRDPGNARFTLFGADGEYLESVPARGGMFTSSPLLPAPDGGFLNSIFDFAADGGRTSLVRHTAAGSPVDTLPLPDTGFEAPTVTARRENSFQTWNVPFSPTAQWTFHPDGYFIIGVSDRYAVDLLRPDGRVLRISRDVPPVPVTPEERSAEETRVTEAMRRLDPSWRWNGPAIPGTKPVFRALFAGVDGRIWVQLHQPGVRIPDDELTPGPDGRPPPPSFREPIVFDVFEPDGRYLGQVRAPDGFATYPRPVFGRDHVWAMQQGDLDVQQIVRFRIDG